MIVLMVGVALAFALLASLGLIGVGPYVMFASK